MLSLRYVLTLLMVLPPVLVESKNNVCKYMLDYLAIDYSKNCWHNPDVGRTVEQLITARGYPLESYDVTTEDGYINIIHRIPHNNIDHNSTRQPILLHAGFSGSPRTFLTIGNRSLAFFLVNNGFDVWLASRRGTAATGWKGHLRLSRTDEEFWNFSFHETGYYDLKAEIDLIAQRSNSSRKIILLGYSMGTTETYVYATLRPRHARKHVAGIVSLSPIAFMKRSGGIFARLAPFHKVIESVLRRSGIHVFYDGWEIKEVEDVRFSYSVLILAKSLLMYVVGYDPSQLDPADLPLYLENQPSSSSIKTLVHFAQEVKADGKFQFYDYGPAKNFELYKSTKPPPYNLSKIRVPVHLFYGEGDLISDKEDVLKLYNELTVKNKSLIGISQDKRIKFNHVDFTVAKDIEKLLYKVLLETINEKLGG